MDRLDRLPPVLAVGVIVVRVDSHRPRSVQRQHGDDVLETSGLHAAKEIAHRGAVELKHSEGVAAGQQLVSGWIIECECLQYYLDAPVRFDVLQRVADDREVAQAEEVHLQQPDGLTRGVVPPGDDRAVLRTLPQRDHIGQRLRTHDHRARVHTGVANQTLESARSLVDRPHIRIGVDQPTHLGGLFVPLVGGVGDPGQRDVLGHHGRRQSLGDSVGDSESRLPIMDSGRVLQCGLGLDGAERDDLRDAVGPPPLGGVTHHLPASAVVEVDVDIGHGRTFRVEEALKKQAMLDGIDISDPQGVGHQGARGRPTTRADSDIHRTCVVDEVRHDQEVRGVSLIADHTDLVGSALGIFDWHASRKAATQTGIHLVSQPGRLVMALGHREHRHPVARSPHIFVGLHPFGDQQCRVTCLGNLTIPERTHLGRRLQVIAVAVEFEPGGIGQGLAGLHAQQCLMVVRGIAGDVMAVVGGQRRDTELAAEIQQAITHPALDGQPVVHQLEEVVLGPEDVPPLGRRFQCLGHLAQPQSRLHLAGGTASGGDDARGMFGDDLCIHPRPLAELAFERRPGGQGEQVA